MAVFLDYASTCPVVKYPQQQYRDVLGKGYFLNPNANYAYREKRLLEQAENRVKKAIGAKGGKVIFGGTSSQLIENLMMGIDSRVEDYRIITSTFEHDAIHRFSHGQLFDLSELEFALRDASNNEFITPFICWQAVQNITGEIFPTKQIGELTHKYNAFYICDATALLGHVAIETNIDDWCDFWCCSGHKAGTELGIGCCWISDRLDEWLNGFKLHGTPNLAGALAMAQAVEDACDKEVLIERDSKWFNLVNELDRRLDRANIKHNFIPTVPASEAGKPFALAINAIRLPGFNADALQQFLASKQVYISIGGSACVEAHDYRVLENGYNLTKEGAGEIIRVSFGENSTLEDIKTLVENICEFKKIYLDN